GQRGWPDRRCQRLALFRTVPVCPGTPERWRSAAAGSGSAADAGDSQLHALVRLGMSFTPDVSPLSASGYPFHTPVGYPCAYLFDHFVRQDEKVRGQRQAEGLGRLEVDDALKPHQLLHRQVGRRGTVQDFVHVGGNALPTLLLVEDIAHETSSLSPL